MDIREISWGDAEEHLRLVNENCSLRSSVSKKSFLHTRSKRTVRTLQATKDGEIVGGLTIRTNAWYLAELKYIFADSRKVLDALLVAAIALGKRPLYQVSVAPGERVLRNALVAAEFEEGVRISYKGGKPVIFTRAVKYIEQNAAAVRDEQGMGPEEPASIESGRRSVDSLNSPRSPEERGLLHKHHDFGFHPKSIAHVESE